ncbi:MAG: hypothetical protein AVDCRST_MAG47-1321, partial [uncultured Nocardioidaceae bacterium]
ETAPFEASRSPLRHRARGLRRRHRAAPAAAVAPHGQRRARLPDVHGGGARGEHARRRALPRRDVARRGRRLARHLEELARRAHRTELHVPLRRGAGRLGHLQRRRGDDRPPAPRGPPRPRRPRGPVVVGPRLPGVRSGAGGRRLVDAARWSAGGL